MEKVENEAAFGVKHHKKMVPADAQLFEGISGAWIDDVSPEEETRKIREARTSGVTRNVDTSQLWHASV